MGANRSDFSYASPKENSNEDDVAYFLVLSGGAFRGALQFWVIAHLMAKYWFRHISGVSVGSINGICASMLKLDLLHDFWTSTENKKGFLKTRWAYMVGMVTLIVPVLNSVGVTKIYHGIYSMKPLLNKLREYVKLENVKIPFACGIVAAQGGDEIYHNIDTRDVSSNEFMAKAIQASSCMYPFMMPPLVDLPGTQEKNPEISIDGGYWNIFPIPWNEIEAARGEGKKVVIHAIGCTPLSRVKRVNKKNFFSFFGFFWLLMRVIEIMEASVYGDEQGGDILQLRYAAGKGGEIHLWVPSVDPGDPFDASKEEIGRRLSEGKSTVERGPIVLPGIGV